MALIKNEFNAHLKAHAGLAGLVGDDIFPHVGTKDQAMPAVMYGFDADNEIDLSGNVVLERYQVQISVVSKSYAQADEIAAQVKDALNIINGDLHNTNIQLCQFSSESESFDEELDAYVLTLNFSLVA